MNLSIQTNQLSRIYKIRGGKKTEPKELLALDDVNLEVNKGELFGLLGPNGAGKTTLIKILTTLLAPTAGWARVAGYDVIKDFQKVRQRINMVSGGESSGYGLLTVRENLWMFAQFYGIPSAEANHRIKVLLDVIGLSDRINTKSSDLSTGLRQKMNIVRGFLTDPEVLFLDEPTLGLDVGASREVRHFVRNWIDQDPSRTLLLTTHYMVEADELCDRIAIINQGRVLACDSPANLKRSLYKEVIYKVEVNSTGVLTPGQFTAIPGVQNVIIAAKDGTYELNIILSRDEAISTVVNELTANQYNILHLEKTEPTLEDVFVDLVGRSMGEVEDSQAEE